MANVVRLTTSAIARRCISTTSRTFSTAVTSTQQTDPAYPREKWPYPAKYGVPLTPGKHEYGYSVPWEEWEKDIVYKIENPKLDGWSLRHYLTYLNGGDMVPDIETMNVVLRKCRELNDLTLAIRFMEATYNKSVCYPDIWPYLSAGIKPTLTELGIPSLEEIGYDKPELACPYDYDLEHKDDWPNAANLKAGKKWPEDIELPYYKYK